MPIRFDLSINPTPVEMHIIKTINQHATDFLKSSSIEFAEQFNFSPSALSRFARKYQFKNYAELKLYVAHQVHVSSLKPQQLRLAKASLLDEATLQQIAPLGQDVIKAQTVLTFGLGISSLPAQFLNITLNNLGINGRSSNDFHNMLELLTSVSTDDLLIIFSRKMRSNEINFLLNAANQMNLKYWYITTNANHPKHATSNYLLLASEDEAADFSAKTKTRDAMFEVVDELVGWVSAHLPTTDEALARHKTAQSLIHKWKKA